jgi:tail assembly chaperone
MDDLEFELDGQTYRAGKLSAFDQFEVASRLAPALIQLGRMRAAGKGEDGKPLGPQDYARALCLMSGQLPREQMDAILGMALRAVRKRQQGADGSIAWAPVLAAGSDRPMFAEFGQLLTCMTALWRVIEASRIPDFFFDPPATSAAQPPAE